MTKENKELATLKFEGDRFADHSLDVDVLSELAAYKRLVVETAKEIWRKQNHDRQRLPKNFESSVTIKFFELKNGSTAVPLVREISARPPSLFSFEDLRDEIDEAVGLLETTISSAGQLAAAPLALPRSVVPLFREFGQSLRDDESIIIENRDRPSVKYNKDAKKHILSWIEPNYRDQLDLVGEVRATDLDSGNFTLRLDDGSKVVGRFSEQQERDILAALGEHQSRRLRVEGTGEFRHDNGELHRIVDVRRIEICDPASARSEGSAEPFWKTIVAVGNRVPSAAWDRVPTDLSENLRHYLYGDDKGQK